MNGAYRHSCGAYVVQSARYGLYDADSARHHYCLNEAPLDDAREVWDTCNDCGGVWIKFGDGPRLHPRTHQPHVCGAVPAAPAPPHVPSPAPHEPLPFRPGITIPRLPDA